MEEHWKDIVFEENGIVYDYRGLYQVSNLGNVKSLGNGKSNASKDKTLKPSTNANGYLFIILYKDGKQKYFRIHRLVAHMFIKNDDSINKTEINHIDENKTNNCVDNLEWCTKEYNNNYGTHNEKVGKALSIFVYFLKPNSEKWFNEPISIIELSRRTGISDVALGRSLHNKKPLNGRNAKYDKKYIRSYVVPAEQD